MIEDYAINTMGQHAKGTGRYKTTQSGGKKEIMRFFWVYETNAGTFRPEEWKKRALAEIEEQSELDTLDVVKAAVRKHCAWLSDGTELEEYAIDCTCRRAYLHWPYFKGISETIIWM